MKTNKKYYMRSAKATLRFTNKDKHAQLRMFIDDYRKILARFVDMIWDMETIPTLLPKTLTDKITSTYSARLLQCAGKQASGIVRGTQKKQNERMWRIRDLQKKGEAKAAARLLQVYNSVNMTKPDVSGAQPELDSRFIDFDFDNATSFILNNWIFVTIYQL